MSATTTKAQPWKSYWSPVDMKSASANQNYMVDGAGSLLIDGVCAGDPAFELACASKKTEAHKAQPWKEHWAPVDTKCSSANQNYMLDGAGSLLIDGCCQGGFFCELACARKDTEAPKAQPWKAHWSPVDMKSMSANQNYMLDSAGSLLIDGCCAGGFFCELACARMGE